MDRIEGYCGRKNWVRKKLLKMSGAKNNMAVRDRIKPYEENESMQFYVAQGMIREDLI